MIKRTFYFINRYKVLELSDAFHNSFYLIIPICYLTRPLDRPLSLLASGIKKASSLQFYRCKTLCYSYKSKLQLESGIFPGSIRNPLWMHKSLKHHPLLSFHVFGTVVWINLLPFRLYILIAVSICHFICFMFL